jgi:hypothetical protein
MTIFCAIRCIFNGFKKIGLKFCRFSSAFPQNLLISPDRCSSAVFPSKEKSSEKVKEIISFNRIRDKGQDENQNNDQPDNFPAGGQGRRFIQNTRMPQAQKKDDKTPDEPAYPEKNSQDKEYSQEKTSQVF